MDLVLTNTPNVILNVKDAGLIGKIGIIEINCSLMRKETIQEVPNWQKADLNRISEKIRTTT